MYLTQKIIHHRFFTLGTILSATIPHCVAQGLVGNYCYTVLLVPPGNNMLSVLLGHSPGHVNKLCCRCSSNTQLCVELNSSEDEVPPGLSNYMTPLNVGQKHTKILCLQKGNCNLRNSLNFKRKTLKRKTITTKVYYSCFMFTCITLFQVKLQLTPQ